jgi:Domain of unknown function (DUF5110)
MPLYVRAGAILPLGPVKQYTTEPVDDALTLVVYPGADGRGSVYEDDGHSFGYQRGEWMRILAEWNDARRTLRLRLAEGSRKLSPMPRRIDVRVTNKPSRAVVFDGSPLEIRL